MTVIFVDWTESYPTFRHSLQAAVQRSRCPVIVFRQQDPKITGTIHIPIAQFKTATETLPRLLELRGESVPLHMYSIARWLLICEFLEVFPSLFPIFAPDWDMVIFSNLNEALKPHEGFDVGCTYNPALVGDSSAAYFIRHPAPLRTFRDIIHEMIQAKSPELQTTHDMDRWRAAVSRGSYRVADMSQPLDTGTFDPSIHCGGDFWEMDGPVKKIVWKDGCPYFTLRKDSRLVKVHHIHCWGTFKGREPDLLREAGIPLPNPL